MNLSCRLMLFAVVIHIAGVTHAHSEVEAEVKECLTQIERDVRARDWPMNEDNYKHVPSPGMKRLVACLRNDWPKIKLILLSAATTPTQKLACAVAAAALPPPQYVEFSQLISKEFIAGAVPPEATSYIFFARDTENETTLSDNLGNPVIRQILDELLSTKFSNPQFKGYLEAVRNGDIAAQHQREYIDRPWQTPEIVRLAEDGTVLLERNSYPKEAIWRVKKALEQVFDEAKRRPGIIGYSGVEELSAFKLFAKALEADWPEVKTRLFPDVAFSEEEQHTVLWAIEGLSLEKYLEFVSVAVDAYLRHRLNQWKFVEFIYGRDGYLREAP